jgi:L-ascorbate metabolism protein UlaG (beta-lactamase superfamily)
MQITHLGHSCLLLEYDATRVLVDPGVFSSDFDFVEGLDAVFVTHQHPDHLDLERLPALLAASPGVRLLVEPSTVEVLARAGFTAEQFAAGEQVSIGGSGGSGGSAGVTVEGVGGQHAEIYREIPRIGNTGLVLRAEGAPTVFHPGDMIDTTPEGIDLLALPLTAPWAALKETIDFVRAVGPAIAVPIHDAIVSPPGRGIYLTQTTNFGPDGMTMRDLAGAGPATF